MQVLYFALSVLYFPFRQTTPERQNLKRGRGSPLLGLGFFEKEKYEGVGWSYE
jgi:hypothetical protein